MAISNAAYRGKKTHKTPQFWWLRVAGTCRELNFTLQRGWMAQLRSVRSDLTFPSLSRLIKPLRGFADRKFCRPSGRKGVFICHLYVNFAVMEIVSEIGLQLNGTQCTVTFELRLKKKATSVCV